MTSGCGFDVESLLPPVLLGTKQGGYVPRCYVRHTTSGRWAADGRVTHWYLGGSDISTHVLRDSSWEVSPLWTDGVGHIHSVSSSWNGHIVTGEPHTVAVPNTTIP